MSAVIRTPSCTTWQDGGESVWIYIPDLNMYGIEATYTGNARGHPSFRGADVA